MDLMRKLHGPAEVPSRDTACDRYPLVARAIRQALISERAEPTRGGLYWETQVAFAYDSCRIEGIELSRNQTRQLFERNRVVGEADLDDVVAVNNHFVMFDYMLDTLGDPLDDTMLRRFNGILRSQSVGGLDAHDDPGEWKKLPNGVSDVATTPPNLVQGAIDDLLERYGSSSVIGYEQIAAFHLLFERIHPFQDGNGRVGRMVMFRECLAHDIVPPLVTDARKPEYYAALEAETDDIAPLRDFIVSSADSYRVFVEPLVPPELLPETDRTVVLRDPSGELRGNEAATW